MWANWKRLKRRLQMKIYHKAYRARMRWPKSNVVSSHHTCMCRCKFYTIFQKSWKKNYSVILVEKLWGVWLLRWHMYLFHWSTLGCSLLQHSMHSAVSIYCWIIQKGQWQRGKNGRSYVCLFTFIIFLFHFIFSFCCWAHATECAKCFLVIVKCPTSVAYQMSNTEKAFKPN